MVDATGEESARSTVIGVVDDRLRARRRSSHRRPAVVAPGRRPRHGLHGPRQGVPRPGQFVTRVAKQVDLRLELVDLRLAPVDLRLEHASLFAFARFSRDAHEFERLDLGLEPDLVALECAGPIGQTCDVVLREPELRLDPLALRLGVRIPRHQFVDGRHEHLALRDDFGQHAQGVLALAEKEDPVPECVVEANDGVRLVRVAREERPHRRDLLRPDTEDPEAVPEGEREVRIRLAQSLPDLPCAELRHSRVDVVEDHHGTIAQSILPGLEVVADRLFGMESVDVKEVDAPLREVLLGVVEAHAHQRREAAVVQRVELRQRDVDLVAVVADVTVAFPRVDGIAARPEIELVDRLAHRGVRVALERAEFDEHPRTKHADERRRERDVPMPMRHVRQPCRRHERLRIVERIEFFIHVSRRVDAGPLSRTSRVVK